MFTLRRVRWLILVALLSSCAPRQEIRIQPRLEVGSILHYEFQTEVLTRLAQSTANAVASTLEGLVTLEMLEQSDQGLLMQIRVEPLSSTRDGVVTNPGPAEERTVLLLSGGGVISDPEGSGKLGDADLDPDALATLLRPSAPQDRLRIGTTWSLEGVHGRMASVLRMDDRDLARLELDAAREVSMQRLLEGQPIELFGTEQAETELLWDLELGQPFSATIHTEATLEVRAGAQFGGVITIDARTRFEST